MLCDIFSIRILLKKGLVLKTKELIDKLLLEKIPLACIARVAEVYETCLQNYVNKKYEEIFPYKRYHIVGKASGKTNHVERLNCNLRQRISRLVRKNTFLITILV